MKTSFLALGFVAGLVLLGVARLPLSSSQTFPSGTIELRILNPTCDHLSPDTTAPVPSNPYDLNDGELDDVEIQAISEGCTLQAIAIAPNGMRLTDIPLLLIRSDPTTYAPEQFGGSRRTDDYGAATWSFQLVPDTDFIYQVISPNPVGQTVGSNPLEIELCTGEGSMAAFPKIHSTDVGRGCR